MHPYTPHIVAAIQSVVCTLRPTRTGDGPWTEALMKSLAACATEVQPSGLSVQYTGCKPNGEWLYDQVWLGRVDGVLTTLHLACESELNADIANRSWRAQIYDFEKLMVARAQYLLFICQVPERSYTNDGTRDRSDLIDKLSAYLNRFQGYTEGQMCLLVVLRQRDRMLKPLQQRSMTCREMKYAGGKWIEESKDEYSCPVISDIEA